MGRHSSGRSTCSRFPGSGTRLPARWAAAVRAPSRVWVAEEPGAGQHLIPPSAHAGFRCYH